MVLWPVVGASSAISHHKAIPFLLANPLDLASQPLGLCSCWKVQLKIVAVFSCAHSVLQLQLRSCPHLSAPSEALPWVCSYGPSTGDVLCEFMCQGFLPVKQGLVCWQRAAAFPAHVHWYHIMLFWILQNSTPGENNYRGCKQRGLSSIAVVEVRPGCGVCSIWMLSADFRSKTNVKDSSVIMCKEKYPPYTLRAQGYTSNAQLLTTYRWLDRVWVISHLLSIWSMWNRWGEGSATLAA